VLVAPPGAGKTTVLPLRLLDEPWLAGRRIVVLEPRRLAARAAAHRLAHLLGEQPGDTVGYQTRDERRIGRTTRLEVVTEGILTRRLQADPELAGTGLVVFDEVHERNLPTDLGLALCLDARRLLRPDLRLLAMSATADTERFARVLGDPVTSTPAPVIVSEGRQHPVEVRWAPPRRDERPAEATAALVLRAVREEAGDVLVFLPGIGEIRRVAELLTGRVGSDVDVLALAGALSPAEQDQALAPSPPGRRRVVLSTDIAETSLTVDGVRVVVDAGWARVPRYDPHTGMTRLTTVPTSRASAEQRAGRAGRLGPGVAYRLWSQLEQSTRRAHLEPEIAQVDLAGLALELAAWGTPEAELRFPDPPPARALQQGRDLLTRLGALDADGRLTDVGRAMLPLPVHPRLAHMVVAARSDPDRSLACVVAALLDERDVLRGRPSELPADLALRVAVLAGTRHDDRADRRTIGRLRERAADIARRVGARLDLDLVDPDHTGAVALLAYPDRLAARRQPGQFQLRTGTAAWVAKDDPLAHERFVVACDLDGDRRSSRLRLGAAIDPVDVAAVLADQVTETRMVVWDRERGDLVERCEVRLDRLLVDERRGRPSPGPAATEALVERVRATRLAALPWTPAALALRERVGFVHRVVGDPWPDWSDAALLRRLDEWLTPVLVGATGAEDLARLDLTVLLRSQLPWPEGARLDELAPAQIEVASGRRVAIDYGPAARGEGGPVLAVRVQDVFGTTVHPTVADGRVPLVVHLLSPADRPIQVTSDLPGFWAGSWAAVRKEMAGRYPKHHWPEDPATAPRRPEDR
jgi:ATP-dependent helicase HrpB